MYIVQLKRLFYRGSSLSAGEHVQYVHYTFRHVSPCISLDKSRLALVGDVTSFELYSLR